MNRYPHNYNDGILHSGYPNAPSELLRLIAKNLTEMVLAYDMDRRLVFANPAVESLTGYSVLDLKRENFICWIHPDDQERMLALWGQVFQGAGFHEEEYRLITKDGRVKWAVASWAPLLDDSGQQVGVQGREYDITQRKLAEAARRHSDERLRADEQRYRLLFENSPFPMWEEDFSLVKSYVAELSAQGITDVRAHLAQDREHVDEFVRRVRILDVNDAARKFYGASSKSDLLGGLSRIFDAAAVETFCEEIAALANGQATFQTEFPVRTLAGEQRLVNMIVSIAEGALHDWSRVIVSFFDITDRKRLEDQFVQSQKMESLGRLAGGIAHDFNNLLTVINGYAEWVLNDMDQANPFRPQLVEIRNAGSRCADLTRQLLAFSRKQVVRLGPLDLNGLIRESQAMLDRMLGDDIRVETQLSADLGLIEADRGQMHQVLMNLAANAREAMPRGGSLTIATRNVEDPDEVVLEVRDTGHGIDEKTQKHLFEPFFTTKSGSRNTGLGLAIVFGIVSHGGGRIEVHSQPEAGALFRVHLPRISSPAEITEAAAPNSRVHRGAGVVLVVEDREEVRLLTCRMLERLGYRVVAAEGGAEALRIAERQQDRISLLLTDVVMPEMNGRELADQFLTICPEAKVIFMSGHTDQVPTRREDSSVFLQKPFTQGQLAEILRQTDGA